MQHSIFIRSIETGGDAGSTEANVKHSLWKVMAALFGCGRPLCFHSSWNREHSLTLYELAGLITNINNNTNMLRVNLLGRIDR